MIPRYIGTAASIEALTSIRGLNVNEEDVLLEDADDSELVALADDTTPGTPASEASGGARYCTLIALISLDNRQKLCNFYKLQIDSN